MTTPEPVNNLPATYETDIISWREKMDASLQAEDGWLTLIGLFWLHEGENTIGGDPASDIPLPAGKLPQYLGVIVLNGDRVTLKVTAAEPVLIDSVTAHEAVLHDDGDSNDTVPTRVKIQSITFFVIKRANRYGIRVRDRDNPARVTFSGRQWFSIKPEYRLTTPFIRHETPRTMEVTNSVGMLVPMVNLGYVEFNLHGQSAHLEAFAGHPHELWFIIKDATSGALTYPAGRFLYASLSAEGIVTLDFNKAFHPPCAFTHFATCPLPPRSNIMTFPIEAGERLSENGDHGLQHDHPTSDVSLSRGTRLQI